MAFPKKTKGWREIVVDGETFRWRFIEDYYLECGGRLTAQSMQSTGQQLDVAIVGYQSWISLPDGIREAKKNLVSITPKLAAEAIRYGLVNGWKPKAAGSPLNLIYRDETFIVAEKPTTA